MRITVLDGHTLNPGDNPWTELEKLGELTEDFSVRHTGTCRRFSLGGLIEWLLLRARSKSGWIEYEGRGGFDTIHRMGFR